MLKLRNELVGWLVLQMPHREKFHRPQHLQMVPEVFGVGGGPVPVAVLKQGKLGSPPSRRRGRLMGASFLFRPRGHRGRATRLPSQGRLGVSPVHRGAPRMVVATDEGADREGANLGHRRRRRTARLDQKGTPGPPLRVLLPGARRLGPRRDGARAQVPPLLLPRGRVAAGRRAGRPQQRHSPG